MSVVKFGDVVKEVKINIDRSNNPYQYYVAGDHMDSEDLTIRRKGLFATDDVGPAFIRLFKPGQVLYGSRRTYLKKVTVADFLEKIAEHYGVEWEPTTQRPSVLNENVPFLASDRLLNAAVFKSIVPEFKLKHKFANWLSVQPIELKSLKLKAKSINP